jgi:hypothetical protein
MYFKYLENQAVPIDTHYNSSGQKRDRELTSVSHLITGMYSKTTVACVQEPTRALLGLSVEYGPLTLHSISNGVETNYNSWDTLTVLGENGRLGTNPLIIKSKNNAGQGIVKGLIVENEMEVTCRRRNQFWTM